MGLLDDAIREHLDLKRARGADPAEIERLEREALGPVRREPALGTLTADPDHDPLHDYADDDYEEEFHVDERDSPEEAPEPPQPKRRFLRRNRTSERPPDEPEATRHDYADNDDPQASDDLGLEHHEASGQHEGFEHDDPALEHHDLGLEHDDPEYHGDASDEPATELHQAAEPPHLTFDRPPKRPRFTPEPPGEPGEDDSAEDGGAAEAVPSREHQESESESESEPEHHEPSEDHHESQATREFDVASSFHDEHRVEQQETEGVLEHGEHTAEVEHGQNEDDAEHGQNEDDVEQGEDEDVLEETPEFLQDTPEHDRLWFEQRPPKDFDFDG